MWVLFWLIFISSDKDGVIKLSAVNMTTYIATTTRNTATNTIQIETAASYLLMSWLWVAHIMLTC